jgi:hypothetical protein
MAYIKASRCALGLANVGLTDGRKNAYLAAMTGTIDKKLREAAHFLNEMRKQEQKAFGDREPFDFNLSAFLNAATSARVAYRKEQDRERNAAIKNWKAAWENGLTGDAKRIYDFMQVDRVAEVHKGGSSRDVKNNAIKVGVGVVYSDGSGTLTVMGSNIPGSGMAGAVLTKPHYYFTIDGIERDVTKVCAEYLALLERMAAQFKMDHTLE